ncbi:hypothetical protein NMG60_11006269 [Bertholletia excelsa]
MQPSEVAELNYTVASYPNPYPLNTSLMQNSTASQFNRSSDPFYHLQIHPYVQEFNPQKTCFSSNSTSDEADEQQLRIINERKQRRMISNRESARRSRMRKQKHLDELWSQVIWLRNENHQLVNKLNHVSESHDRVLQENAHLKEEASELRRMITDMQLNSPYPTVRDLDDINGNTVYRRTESSNQSDRGSNGMLG